MLGLGVGVVVPRGSSSVLRFSCRGDCRKRHAHALAVLGQDSRSPCRALLRMSAVSVLHDWLRCWWCLGLEARDTPKILLDVVGRLGVSVCQPLLPMS